MLTNKKTKIINNLIKEHKRSIDHINDKTYLSNELLLTHSINNPKRFKKL